MSELLAESFDADPLLTYDHKTPPSYAAQREFFRYALEEGDLLEDTTRHLSSVYYNDFREILQTVDEKIKAIDPSFTPEYIAPFNYQSHEVRHELGTRFEVQLGLHDIARERQRLVEELAEETILPALALQTISPGVLDVPPVYCRQGEDWKSEMASRACTNACFRMVFGAITGWVPSETALAECVVARHGTLIVDDAVYNNLYKTEVFKEVCDKDIVNIELLGADFQTIQKLAAKMKQRRGDAKVYCTVNLASVNASKRVWHTCVLIGTEDGKVVYHDPSSISGGEFMRETYGEFALRWASAYNRALLTIAA